MEQAKDLVSRINQQVLELLSRHRNLKSEHSGIKAQNDELKETIEKLNTEIDQLKEQIVKLKISKSLTDKKDSKEVKAKVDELLREIDNCVGLLNQ